MQYLDLISHRFSVW